MAHFSNSQFIGLASGSRTTTQTIASTSMQGGGNLTGQGIRVVVKTTTVGSGSITATIQGVDANGTTHTLLAGAAIVTDTTNVYQVFPGAPVTTNVSANSFLPQTWNVVITANNANAAIYQVGIDILR
jgi:hypothetical protein